MPNIIDANGLQTSTLPEEILALDGAARQIYGQDIVTESNSEDGQWINILAQNTVDLLSLLTAINNGFDPDFAEGVTLDQRCAINNIYRQGATYTFQDVRITVDRALNLQGLDAAANDLDGTGFTVGDNAGNQFILLDSQEILGAGTYTFSFRAKALGAVITAPNTITNPITVVLGVTGINNLTGATSIGQNGETDYQLRERRKQSVALGSTGYLNGLQGAILNLDGVVDCKVYENYTNITDADGIPAHSIYVVVGGGADDEIANQIYSRKCSGCGMKGTETYDIATPSGQTFEAKFERTSAENLYLQFSIQPLLPDQTFNEAAIKNYLISNITFKINQAAIAETIAEVARAAINSVAGEGSGAVINMEVSDDGIAWLYYLLTSNIKNTFSLSADNIDITVLT